MGLLDRLRRHKPADGTARPSADVESTEAMAPRGGVEAEPVDTSIWRMRPWRFQDMTMPPLGEWSFAPVRPERALGLNFEEDEEPWEIVGESRFLKRFAPLVAAWRAAGAEEGALKAMLVHEPLNPFDRHAVRVDLLYEEDVETCGYIPKERAYELHKPVKASYEKGLLVVTAARAFGGDSPEKPNVGIWLGGQVA